MFWDNLKKPIMILAPMEGVTDTVFRQIVTSVGKPDVYFSEFVPVDAILSPGKPAILRCLEFSEIERPIVAQIWGTDPDKFEKVAKILVKMGFDGIDINMGCPVHDVVKTGACSGLIHNPKLAKEIILATIQGAPNLPVSVKTRIGFKEIQIEEWVSALLSTPIAALTLHLRTTKEQSKPPAHWDEIEKAVKIRNDLGSKTLIIGNGDVKSLKEAREKIKKYGIDGVMIGRGIFENVYLFNQSVDPGTVTPSQKKELLLKHLALYKEIRGEGKQFALMKKFVKCYINNFDGAAEARSKLMETTTLQELIKATKALKV
jgi:nifR3 family TIM-barrel protein